MDKLSSPENSRKSTESFSTDLLFHESCILDVESFVNTLSSVIDKGIRPNLIGPIITHYASKWLQDLISNINVSASTSCPEKESAIDAWMKKRVLVEQLVGILPNDANTIPCNFLLRLLRAANMMEAEANCLAELEKRVAWQLDQASVEELMIPSFNHTCVTLLDVKLVNRIVTKFVESAEELRLRSAALIKVGKLIDSYLAEAALDSNLSVEEFIGLAGALPDHARFSHDGLYRAIDTYLKAHPGILSKQEKKRLSQLLDSRKFSPEAALHATHNDRLPVRYIIQIFLSEQTKLVTRNLDWSGSLMSVTRSPNMCHEGPIRCQSKRESTAQQMEIKKLGEDMMKLQKQCISIQSQMEKVLERKKKGLYSTSFHWKKLGSVAAMFWPGGRQSAGESCE